MSLNNAKKFLEFFGVGVTIANKHFFRAEVGAGATK